MIFLSTKIFRCSNLVIAGIPRCVDMDRKKFFCLCENETCMFQMAENRCVIMIVYLHHQIRLMASHKYRVSILVAQFSTKSFFCTESLIPDLLPQVSMEFSTIEEAGMFWVTFGGQKKL